MDDHRYFGVEVKVQSAPTVPREDELTKQELEVCWERCTMAFWSILREAAREQSGVEDVYADGRSGGWAVPEPHIDPKGEEARFKEFKNLCDLTLSDILENAWPEAVKQMAEEKAAAIELAERQTRMDVTLTWTKGSIPANPDLKPDFIQRIFSAALEANGLHNFELEVKAYE